MKTIIFIALMLISSISISAQTAADVMYKEGITLKSQKTKNSLSTAISKFKNAAGLYASLANKNKCEVQIAVCKVYQKRLSQATARHKTYSKNTQASRSKQQSTLEKAVATPSGTNKAVASEENFSEEFKIMRDAAIKGDANAQFYMACKYGMGEELSKDEQEAYSFFMKSAARGYAPAVYNVGVCYYTGKGVAQDNDEALKWFKKDAGMGNADAISALKELGIL